MTPYSPVPGESYARPEQVLALSDGNCLCAFASRRGPGQCSPCGTPQQIAFSVNPAAEQHGLGVLARTGDHAKVGLASNNANSDLVAFGSAGGILLGPLAPGNGASPLAAANSDGSRFAIQFVSNGASQILSLDAALNRINAVSSSARGITFSRDDNFLYVSGNSAARPVIQIFDGRSLTMLGEIPDVFVQGLSSAVDSDEMHQLFAIANRGVSFLDAATCGVAALF